MKKPFISFILAAYKEKYLREAIQSILKQTYSYFELVIIDDASPENINGIVEEFSDSRIIYHRNSVNIGGQNLVKQWNENCLPKAKGEFVIMASDDDIYDPEYLENMVGLTQYYPDCDLFHCRGKKIDAENNIIDIFVPCAHFETCLDFISQRLCYHRNQTVQEFMFRKSAMERIGGFVDFPLAFFSDDATWNLLALRGGVACSPYPLFSFRFSDINISSNEESSERMLLKLEACFKYTNWLKKFLELYVPNNELDILLLQKLRKHLKIKKTEWINWTTLRCNIPTLYFINRKYYREYHFAKWVKLWVKNLLRKIKT